jgi:hypothetical protein
MTTGLIRSESGGDLRTLAAMGAAGRTRRTLTAATAAGLALLGVLLGIGGAYLTLLAVYLNHLTYLGHSPILYLVAMAIGIPSSPPAPAGCSPDNNRQESPDQQSNNSVSNTRFPSARPVASGTSRQRQAPAPNR